MELLVLLLLSPAIFAQHYQKHPDPNNEPFLPIYPAFPYSPKLIKRGTEKDVATPGVQDSYAPKQDARDSYSSSFGGNFQKHPSYSLYNSFSKTPTPGFSPFSSPFSSSPFGSNPFGSNLFGSSPFGSHSFGSSPFPAGPFNASPYNSLNSYASAYQNSPLPPFPPSPFGPNAFPNFYQPPANLPNFYNQYPQSLPPPGADYPNRNNDEDNDDDRKGKKGGRGRYKEDNEDLNDNQFTDGANFLSSNNKDLDGQSTTYKGSGSFRSPNSNLANKLNGIPGQSASLDYPSTTYIKPHQLEQLMRQTLIKLLTQHVTQQSNQVQYPVYESNPNSPNQNNVNNNGQSYVSVPNVLAKTGLSYVVNPTVLNKPNNQISIDQAQQTQALIGKNQRYPDSQYQKQSSLFIPSLKANRNPVPLQSPDYGDFEAQPSQVDQNYQGSSSQEQRTNYKSQNLVTQTPQPPSHQHSSYQPTPIPKLSDQRDSDNISINFSSKQKEKRG